jgi:hypothetical protein
MIPRQARGQARTVRVMLVDAGGAHACRPGQEEGSNSASTGYWHHDNVIDLDESAFGDRYKSTQKKEGKRNGSEKRVRQRQNQDS